ncbi:MAG: methylated-DNA--[protein]-cysteine S-methyltransferase [Candidatus Eisenbacteria bacterium]
MQTSFAYYDSPIGLIEIGGTSEGVTSLFFVEERRAGAATNDVCEEAVRQIGEYFAGSRQEFDLPIALRGTEFQREVWRGLQSITYGQTVSYGDLARAIGKPAAVRAVGAANGDNPISIIVPCHRVIGSDGGLTGYGGGLERKEWLLRHEGGLLL